MRLPEWLHLPVRLELGRRPLPVLRLRLLLSHVLRRVQSILLLRRLLRLRLLLVLLWRSLPKRGLLLAELLTLWRRLLLLQGSGLLAELLGPARRAASLTERLKTASATTCAPAGSTGRSHAPRRPLRRRRIVGLRRQVDGAGRRDGQPRRSRLRAADAVLATCRSHDVNWRSEEHGMGADASWPSRGFRLYGPHGCRT